MKTALLILAVFAVIAGAIVWELAAWRECLAAGHSWWYCLRLFG